MLSSISIAVFCWNISESNRASNFKIYYKVAHDSLYILIGNDVIIYFRSAANRTNVPISGHVRVAISRKRLNRFKIGLLLCNQLSSASVGSKSINRTDVCSFFAALAGFIFRSFVYCSISTFGCSCFYLPLLFLPLMW